MIEDAELENLLNRIHEGDESAFEELVNKTEKSIFLIAYNMIGNKQDALDVCQEVYIKLFRYINSYKTGKKFHLWLYKITVNCCYDFIKNKGKVYTPLAEIEQEITLTPSFIDEQLSNKQLLEKAFKFLNLLTPSERAIFLLRDVYNLSTKEISKILSCTQITVRRHSNSARQKLKKFLDHSKNTQS